MSCGHVLNFVFVVVTFCDSVSCINTVVGVVIVLPFVFYVVGFVILLSSCRPPC